MHQGHNIPWGLIESNFEFKENNKHFTPAVTGLFSKNRPNCSKEMKHFVSRFAHTIRTFSDTERAKYPIRTEIKLVSEGNIFSDEVMRKYPKYLNEKNQRLENWISWAKKRACNNAQGSAAEDTNSYYDSGYGNLADVVKILLHENELEVLLMMANHPDIPLSSLHNLHWGHWFGFSRVKESAVRAYLFFNSADATGTLEDGRYARSRFYSTLLRELGVSMDYPAQQIPHREFFRSCGFYGDCGYDSEGFLDSTGKPCGISEDTARNISVHHNRALLTDYLKTLFALMYRYDVIMQECGLEPCWELEIGLSYPLDKTFKVGYKWVEEKQQWISELA